MRRRWSPPRPSRAPTTAGLLGSLVEKNLLQRVPRRLRRCSSRSASTRSAGARRRGARCAPRSALPPHVRARRRVGVRPHALVVGHARRGRSADRQPAEHAAVGRSGRSRGGSAAGGGAGPARAGGRQPVRRDQRLVQRFLADVVEGSPRWCEVVAASMDSLSMGAEWWRPVRPMRSTTPVWSSTRPSGGACSVGWLCPDLMAGTPAARRSPRLAHRRGAARR